MYPLKIIITVIKIIRLKVLVQSWHVTACALIDFKGSSLSALSLLESSSLLLTLLSTLQQPWYYFALQGDTDNKLESECYFQPCQSSKPLLTSTTGRIHTIINCSKARQDGKAVELEARMEANEHFTIKFHKNCVSSYTSKTNIERIKRRLEENPEVEQAPKRGRRSSITSFNFREHCLFCGEPCVVERDSKNPNRWRPAFLCRTAERGDRPSFKQSILSICDIRNDELSQSVKMRVLSAVSDLHAADARYHDNCRVKFMSPRSVASSSRVQQDGGIDPAINETIATMMIDMSRIWNSCEIYDLYIENGGTSLSKRMLISKLCDIIGSDLLVLRGNGVASLLLFRSGASAVLRLVKNDTEDEDDAAIDLIAKKIVVESKQLRRSNSEYDSRMNMDIAMQSVSSTLLALLEKISNKFGNTATSALIGNIVTSVVTNQPTSLQIALSVLVNRKTLIEALYEYSVCCSYWEYLRFKASSAKAAEMQTDLRGIVNADKGLVQVVADNFDSNVSSQNGLLSTHCLAVLLAVRDDKNEVDTQPIIRRLSREEMKDPIRHDVQVYRYEGPKKSPMPPKEAERQVLSLKVLVHQAIALSRCKDLDFQFLKGIVSESDTPEFAGYNTKLCREEAQTIKPATRAIYTPLIDMDPADSDTMLTAMEEAKRLTYQCGQGVTIFTNDQQLYKIAVHITWMYPDRFQNFIPRLGGMHTLMSFIGCVGNLMADSGLEEIMTSAFGSVSKMLAGKMFPQNFRALRFVAEEILRPVISHVISMDELMEDLENKATSSPTSKLWLENLVKPVFIMMVFVRAEREGEWPLHLWAVQQMLPYFFAAGHHQYARYGTYYLFSMEKLHGAVLEQFMKGEHLMRHKEGLWNGIWSDMFVESTFMRYGKGPQGIIGVTMKPDMVKKWAYSMHICSRILQDLSDMADGHQSDQDGVISHKEEKPSRIRSDGQDRDNIRMKLKTCIDPFDAAGHGGSLMNIASGRIATDKVNAHKAIEIGREQLNTYIASWPEGFDMTIPKKVVTMAVAKKGIRVGSTEVFDATLIYSRVLGLMATRYINFQEVLKHELAPMPTSMFDEKGEMRIAKNKSVIKQQLKIDVSARLVPPPQATVIDGCAIFWVVHWPNKGTVEDYVSNFCHYVLGKAKYCDVYLVFDRYYDFSIKSGTRLARASQCASRRHMFTMSTPLPPQKVYLTVTENKVQLIELICQHLISITQEQPLDRKLVITGKDPTPIEVLRGAQRELSDFRTTHEEADVIIVQQVAKLANAGTPSIRVICDDTDVFVLLMYFYHSLGLTCALTMESTGCERALIDIGASVEKHKDIIPYLPGAHALTGCDTVAQCFMIGKATALKTLRAGIHLPSLGNIEAHIDDIVNECTAFMARCYGSYRTDSMSDVRVEVWAVKAARRKATAAPELKMLPPTTAAFQLNARRAHIQTAIWMSCLEADPAPLDPVLHGWRADNLAKSLVPLMLPPTTPLAPMELLELIHCRCASDKPCFTAQCRCNAAKLPCTIFCACYEKSNCRNEKTITASEADAEVINMWWCILPR